MKNDVRNIRMSKRQAQMRMKRKMKQRMLLVLLIVSYIIAALYMRNINAQIKQLKVILQKIENMRYETREEEQDEISDAEKEDYVSSISVVEVGKPRNRTWTEILQKLNKLGENHPLIEEISQNSSLYPENMLAALANNPEMADYVAGYPEYMQRQDNGRIDETAGQNDIGGWSEAEKEQEYPLLLQWDPRWGYQSYGSSNYIGVAGCGPTCLAMVLYYLTEDEMFTPDKIAAYAMENGYYVEGTGTAWALMKDLPNMYGIEVTEHRISERALRSALEQGEVLICAMREGDFTAAGHFIVIYGYDEYGFKVNDPNCVARSRKRWTYDEIGEQIKCVWGYGKDIESFTHTTFFML